MKYFMGIDMGTQGTRIGVFDEEGKQVVDAGKSWETNYPKPGWAEQDPNIWWECVELALEDASEQMSDEVKANIATVAVDATASTFFAIDKNINPLCDALMWMDMRATEEAAELNATGHAVLDYCGGEASPEWFVPKLMWIKRHEPDLYNDAYKFMDQLDWINYKLSGVVCSCMCTAVCKYHYVQDLGGYCQDFYDSIGLEDWNDKVFERIELIGADLGNLKPEICEKFGISKDAKLIMGGIDAHIGMFGTNAFTEGKLSVNMGTSFCILGNINDSSKKLNSFWGPYKNAVCEGSGCIEGGQSSAAGLVNWFVRNFHIDRTCEIDVYVYLAEALKETEPGAGGLIMLDHFQGNRTPYKDPFSKGAFYGLTMQHSWKDIYRAVLEGVAFGTYNVIERYEEEAFEIEEIVACGGGTKNIFWVQMISDICGKPIVVNECDQGCVLGCCVVGAAAYAYDGDYEKAANALVHKAETYLPNMELHEFYKPIFEKYKTLYETTKKLGKM